MRVLTGAPEQIKIFGKSTYGIHTVQRTHEHQFVFQANPHSSATKSSDESYKREYKGCERAEQED
jgi:hypothetical protein